jgi:transposase
VLKKSPDAAEYERKALELAQLIKLEEQQYLEIYFADESGFNETPCVPYGWQEKGKELSIPSQKGQRCNVFGLMTRRNKLIASITAESIKSTFVIEQIDKLCYDKTRKTKTVVVLDNARIHHTIAIKQKIEEWKEQDLEIFYLPTYSPHLNFIETLWRKMKYEWILPSHYNSWKETLAQIHNIIDNFGQQFTIKFANI